MATEDRTAEFLAIAQSLEAEGVGGRNGPPASGGGGPPPYPISRAPTGIHDNTSSGSGAAAPMRGRYGGASAADPSDPANELRNFHGTASEISRDIAATSAMLSELASLVRRRNLFVDDTERVNWLVLRIKTSVQSLDGRLDEAGAVIARNKRRLGRNSQRGEEVVNLGETLKEEYEQIGMGFKSLLEERSARMKDNEDRKKGVIGGGGGGGDGDGQGELVLGNRPMVYDSHDGSGAGSAGDRDALPGSGGLGGGPNSFLAANSAPGGPGAGPRLDLTSAVMMGKPGGGGGGDGQMSAGEPSGSGSYLPRPGEC